MSTTVIVTRNYEVEVRPGDGVGEKIIDALGLVVGPDEAITNLNLSTAFSTEGEAWITVTTKQRTER